MKDKSELIDEVLLKVRFFPDVNFKPLGNYPHNIELHHDKILTEAKATLQKAFREAKLEGKIQEHSQINRMRRDITEDMATLPVHWLDNRVPALRTQLTNLRRQG